MSSEKRITLNVYKMFPEAARRVRILEELKRSWKGIVRYAAQSSEPYCLGVNELCVEVWNEQAKSMLIGMKGSILRRMTERWGYKSDGEFSLKLTDVTPKPAIHQKKSVKKVAVEVSEEKVRQYMQGAPETLPEDINHALSHLKVFLEQRFPEKSEPAQNRSSVPE